MILVLVTAFADGREVRRPGGSLGGKEVGDRGRCGKLMDQVDQRIVKLHARAITHRLVQKVGATDPSSGDLDLVSQWIGALVAPCFYESGVVLEYFELKPPRFNRASEAAAVEQDVLRLASLACEEAAASQIPVAGEVATIPMRAQGVRTNQDVTSLNYLDPARPIDWRVRDGGAATPYLTIQPPGGSGAPGIAGASVAPSSGPPKDQAAPWTTPVRTPPAP